MIQTITTEELQAITERLKTIGYNASESDEMAIMFTGGTVKSHILNQINGDTIPYGLYHAFIDMVCGEFLSSKFNGNTLPDFDIDSAIQSISMGDVSVSYNANMSVSGKFKVLIDTLISGGEGDLVCYRKLKW